VAAYLRPVDRQETAAEAASEAGTAPGSQGAERVESPHTALPASTAAPLSPARAALAAAQRRLQAANAALQQAQAPIERMSRLVAGHDARQRRLAELLAVAEEELTAWLMSDQVGQRPALSPEIAELGREIQIGAADSAAAEKAIGTTLQPAAQRAAEMVRVAGIDRTHAALLAAVAIAHELIVERYAPALRAMLEVEAELRSVEDAIRARNDDPTALAMAAQLSGDITQAKQAAAVPRDPEPGRRLLDALLRGEATARL
jgi:hypothetical protein